MGAETTTKDSLNTADPNRTDAAFREVGLGDLVAQLIREMAATESGLTPTDDVITLADQPSTLFDVEVTAGTVTGVAKLLKGPISGNGAVAPKTGECCWDGGTKILFNAADAVGTVDVKYTLGDEKASILMRSIGEIDTP